MKKVPCTQALRKTKRELRSGFTTGACAAAAAKGAMLMLVTGARPEGVTIPFPNGSRHYFRLENRDVTMRDAAGRPVTATASVIKDAGDDPDVTNGAEIIAAVCLSSHKSGQAAVVVKAGSGVGTVTRQGLAVPPGEPAINPGPRTMIREAVKEALETAGAVKCTVEVTIAVTNGELLAEHTLNRRLGIEGGISILGTTGIVRPVSSKAWTDTIEVSMNVARAAGLKEIVLSTGRTSERYVQEMLDLPEESLVMMGDYLSYSLKAAARMGFSQIHLAGMWAKIVKAALEIPQTHVRNGALDARQTADLLACLGLDKAAALKMRSANTAREIYQLLKQQGRTDIIKSVCIRAREYAEKESGLAVKIYLVTSDKGIVAVAE